MQRVRRTVEAIVRRTPIRRLPNVRNDLFRVIFSSSEETLFRVTFPNVSRLLNPSDSDSCCSCRFPRPCPSFLAAGVPLRQAASSLHNVYRRTSALTGPEPWRGFCLAESVPRVEVTVEGIVGALLVCCAASY